MEQRTQILVTFMFTSNTHFQDRHDTHFYGTFAFSNIFLTKLPYCTQINNTCVQFICTLHGMTRKTYINILKWSTTKQHPIVLQSCQDRGRLCELYKGKPVEEQNNSKQG